MDLQNMQNHNLNLLLSTDAKPRLKWTPDLHHLFVQAVSQLGGPDKATPKGLMRVMGVPRLTLYHLKSHLQKYRLGKTQITESCIDDKQEDYSEIQSQDLHPSRESNQINESLQITQALQVQMEVQKKLHEEIKVQRHLQLRIEAQGKYLQSVLKKAQETLAGYNSSSLGVEQARAELSHLVSMVNSGCPSSSLSELTETGGLSLKHNERKQVQGTICSMESSLTSSESCGRIEENEAHKTSPTSIELPLMDIHPGDQATGRKRSRSTISDDHCLEPPSTKRSQEKAMFGWSGMLDLNSKYQTDIDSGKSAPFLTWDVEEVSGKSFDYIVVGGGTAGCPLAATLSKSFSVLLVERGDLGFDNPLIFDRNKYGFSLIQTDEYSSVAQSFISQDGVGNLRGRVLGGSSAINGGFYSRASADFVKRVGWDEELVKEAYEWVESKIIFKPELSPWQSVVEFGFLEAGIEPCNGFTLDHVEGTKIGGSSFDECGKRHTSADLLKAGNQKSMTVVVNATVKNLIFHNNSNGSESMVRGIRFIKSNGNDNNNNTEETYEAYLNQAENSSSNGDVILTAGAIGSPQILLLSGIGPEKHLRDHKIPVMVNLKWVGEGMKDNPGIAIVADSQPRDQLPEPPQVVGIAKDLRIIVEAGIIPISPNSTRMPIAAKVAFPVSKGKLELNSTDPRQNPSVRFNYLQKEQDLLQCVEIYQLVEKVARSQSVTMYLGTEFNKHEMTSENQLRKLCKKNVRTYYHFHGGCLVGSVVDESYRVFGVKGLRVVDGSTLHESPGTNPMATLLMLGRYQGIKILRERRDSNP